MNQNISQELKDKLNAISKHIAFLASNTHQTKGFIDIDIQSMNQKLGLSNVLAQIILSLKIPSFLVKDFKQELKEFNSQRETNLIDEDFLKLGWIRFINGEVRMPDVVKSFLRNLDERKKDDNHKKLISENQELIEYLKFYHDKYFTREEKPFINERELSNILNNT